MHGAEVVDGLAFTIAMGFLAVVAEGRQEIGAVGDAGSVRALGEPGHEETVTLRLATDQAEETVSWAPGSDPASRQSFTVHKDGGSGE